MLKDLGALINSALSWAGANVASELETIHALQVEDRMQEELAYAILLVDIARIDGEFHESARSTITSVLAGLFKISPKDAAQHIASAEGFLNSFRGPSMVIEKIREQYSEEERARLYGAIDSLIAADGNEDIGEDHLRQKFRALLG